MARRHTHTVPSHRSRIDAGDALQQRNDNAVLTLFNHNRSNMLRTTYLKISALALLVLVANGFSLSSKTPEACKRMELHAEEARRSFFRNSIHSITLFGASQILAPASAVMTSDQDVFKTGKSLSIDEAKTRFKEGRKSLKYLLDNYDKVVEGGGDNVRRYLGTVGTTSGLWGIGKVMRTLQNEADDIVDYTETMQEVEASIRGADSAAYMAIFVTTSSSGTPPEKYFGDAKIEANRALKAMDDLAGQLKLE